MKKLLGEEVLHKKYGKGLVINAKKSGANSYLLIQFESGKKDWFNMDKIQIKVKKAIASKKVEKVTDEVNKMECKTSIAFKVSLNTIEDNNLTAEMLEGTQESFALDVAEKGSFAILTGKAPKSKETQRMIFAVGVIESISEKTLKLNGDYSVILTAEEAEKVLFWNFHKNTNAKTTAGLIRWGTTQTRNISELETVQILKTISEIKTDGKKLFDCYCKFKNIEKSTITEPDGGLQAQDE